MSWFINTAGSRSAVKAVVLANTSVPPALKAAIVECIDDVTPTSRNGIRIVGNGHQGGGYSSITGLTVEAIDLAVEVTTPTPILPVVAAAETLEERTARETREEGVKARVTALADAEDKAATEHADAEKMLRANGSISEADGRAASGAACLERAKALRETLA